MLSKSAIEPDSRKQETIIKGIVHKDQKRSQNVCYVLNQTLNLGQKSRLADLLAFLCVMILVSCHFPIWCPRSGVVLNYVYS